MSGGGGRWWSEWGGAARCLRAHLCLGSCAALAGAAGGPAAAGGPPTAAGFFRPAIGLVNKFSNNKVVTRRSCLLFLRTHVIFFGWDSYVVNFHWLVQNSTVRLFMYDIYAGLLIINETCYTFNFNCNFIFTSHIHEILITIEKSRVDSSPSISTRRKDRHRQTLWGSLKNIIPSVGE